MADVRRLRDLMEDEVTFRFSPEIEDEIPEDYMEDAESIAWVRNQSEAGNGFAWFCACVTASWAGFEARSYLGCCSYESEADFFADASYADMRREALGALNQHIAETYEILRYLEVRRD